MKDLVVGQKVADNMDDERTGNTFLHTGEPVPAESGEAPQPGVLAARVL